MNSAQQNTYTALLAVLSLEDKARHLEADVDGHQVLWDKSGGAGRHWVLADRTSLPDDIRQDIAAEILDHGNRACDDFLARNGQHYRWC